MGTALHWAALNGNADAARLLIKAGADVNVQKLDNLYTPLHVAAERDSAEVAKLLIENGANVEINAGGRFEYRPLHRAAGGNSTRMIAILLEAGADIEGLTAAGTTPLFIAAYENAVEAVETLVGAGAKIDAKLPGSGRTPLHIAAQEGRFAAVHKLLELGADVNGAPTMEPVARRTTLGQALRFRGRAEVAEIPRAALVAEE